jgi:trans-aconitate methyltransferase
MTDFSSISEKYKKKSLVQASASQELINLLSIAVDDDILDVGCGSGNVTLELRKATTGRVVGIDPSPGMIREAKVFCNDQDIEFHVMADNEMSFSEEFDIVFCNSAFQWFDDALATLHSFWTALRRSGKTAIQAPAKKRYSPNFIEAIEYACELEEIDEIYKYFRNPWFFCDSEEEYRALFEQAGFSVEHCKIETVHQFMTAEKVLDVFNSGAAAGYLNQRYFSIELPETFSVKVLNRIKESFDRQAGSNGQVDLVFNRIYALGRKES